MGESLRSGFHKPPVVEKLGFSRETFPVFEKVMVFASLQKQARHRIFESP
jgi:hypothetical protein